MANGNGNGGALTAATDHALVKTFTPLVVAGLLGIVGWLFSTVLDLEETVSQQSIHIEHLHEAEDTFSYQMKELKEVVTGIRIHLGKVTAH